MARPQGIRERIESGADKSPAPAVYFRTGSTMLDLVCGGGRGKMGLKGGVLTRIVAVNSGGKSSLATEMLANNIRRPPAPGFWHEYLDREYRFAFDTKGVYGVDMNVRKEDCPRTIEALSAHLGTKLKAAKGPGIVVIDSLEAFSSEETEDRAVERESQHAKGKDIVLDGSYTAKTGAAALLSETLRITLADAMSTGSLLVTLSQIRVNLEAVGKFSQKTKKIGGAALDHWVDTELWLKPIKYLTVGDKKNQTERTIGFVGKAWEEKGTKDRPYRDCLYTVLYGYGVDNIGDMIDYLFDLRDPKTGGLWNPGRTGCVEDCMVSPILCNWAGTVKDLDTVGAWLTAADKLEECKDACKAEKRRISMSFLDEWISRDPELYAAYVQEFPVFTRDQLIQAVENDEEMKAELERRVIAKWELVEQEAASQVTCRKRKF